MLTDDELWEAIAAGRDSIASAGEFEKELWARFGKFRAAMILDSTGFSRTTQSKGIVFYLTILARLRQIGRETFSRYPPIHARAEADNLFVVFENVDTAAAAALYIHQRIREENIMMAENDPYRTCIGIGYGRMLVSSAEGCFGDEMNLASKLGEDIAEAEEILLTKAAYEALNDRDVYTAEYRTAVVSGVDFPYYSLKKDNA